MTTTALLDPTLTRPSEPTIGALDGMRDIQPFLVAIAPVGTALGAATAASTTSTATGWFAGPILASGSTQFALLGAAGQGASIAAACLVAWAVTGRLLLYSADLAPAFRTQPLWFRLLGGHLIIDQTYALAKDNLDPSIDDRSFRRYWLGAALPLLGTYVGTITLGMVAGPLLPTTWRLDLAGVVLIAAMVRPALTGRSSIGATATGGLVTYLLAGLPAGMGILAGAALGMAAGGRIDRTSAADPDISTATNDPEGANR